jgi:hypothetical protein
VYFGLEGFKILRGRLHSHLKLGEIHKITEHLAISGAEALTSASNAAALLRF